MTKWICYWRHKKNTQKFLGNYEIAEAKRAYPNKAKISGYTYVQLKDDGTILFTEIDSRKNKSQYEYWSFWREEND